MPNTIRVLLVGGERRTTARSARQLGQYEGVEVVAESDAGDALERLAEEEFDCVVSDVDADAKGEVDLFAAVRERSPHLPVLLFTETDGTVTTALLDADDAVDGGYDLLASRIRCAVERGPVREERAPLMRNGGVSTEVDPETEDQPFAERQLVGLYMVENGVFEYVNDHLAAVFGCEPDELLGESVASVVTAAERDRVGSLFDGGEETFCDTVTGVRRDGERVTVELFGSHVDVGRRSVVIGALVGHGGSSGRVRALGQLYEMTQVLTRASGRREISELTVESAADILDLRVSCVNLVDGSELAPVAATDEARELFGEIPTFSPEDECVWRAFEERTVRLDSADENCVFGSSVGSAAAVPLGEHGVFLTVDDADIFDEGRLELLKLLTANVEAALDRADRERRLRQLHTATRKLMSAPREEDVTEIAADTANDVLGLSISAIHFWQNGRLEPVAQTTDAKTLLDEIPAFDLDDSLAGEVYQTQEMAVYDDVSKSDKIHNPDTKLRSELIVPLGDYGIFMAGSTAPDEFDETLVSLAQIFAANVEAALNQADREQRLRQREQELRRQNERLNEFSSVVSHDLRNPLGIAEGNLELAREEYDSPNLEAVAKAHRRMRSLIDDLLTLARQGQTVGETEPADLRLLVAEAWSSVEGGRLVAPNDLGTVECDRTRAGELLANLFSNAVDHGGTDVRVEIQPLADGEGFSVEDDGPGIPADNREKVFDYGFTTHEKGTGFGLAIVRSIAEAHGWTIEITDSESGGARFEIRF